MNQTNGYPGGAWCAFPTTGRPMVTSRSLGALAKDVVRGALALAKREHLRVALPAGGRHAPPRRAAAPALGLGHGHVEQVLAIEAIGARRRRADGDVGDIGDAAQVGQPYAGIVLGTVHLDDAPLLAHVGAVRRVAQAAAQLDS